MEDELPEHDVVDSLFEALDRALDTVYDKVVRPLLLVGRFIAVAFVLALVAIVVLVALVDLFVRFSTVYFFAGHVWIADTVVGALSLTLGLVISERSGGGVDGFDGCLCPQLPTFGGWTDRFASCPEEGRPWS